MNSFHKITKHFRIYNIKTTLSTIKECTPKLIETIPKESNLKICSAQTLAFSPRNIGFDIADNRVIPKIKQDPIPYIPIVNPRSILPLIENGWNKNEIGLPAIEREEKQAVRLIVIRRKKMNKHKLRKLWKRMRHRWARVKQKRRQKKEKRFQAELLALIKDANEFSAEQYVKDKLSQANHVPLPTTWRHKRLPEFIIRQLMGLDKKIHYKRNDVYKV